MSQERWYFWKSKHQKPAGVSELERSESSLTPATPPAEEGPAESRREFEHGQPFRSLRPTLWTTGLRPTRNRLPTASRSPTPR